MLNESSRPALLADLWRKIVGTGAAQFYSVATGLITLAITARWLGPEGRGEVAVVTTWALAIATFIGFSLGQVALNRAGLERDDEWVRGALPTLTTFAVVAVSMTWMLGALLLSSTGLLDGVDVLLVVLGALYFPAVLWEQYNSALLQALNALGAYNRQQVIARTVTLVGIVLFVSVFNWGVQGALVATLLGAWLLVVLSLRKLSATARIGFAVDWRAFKAFLADGFKLHANTLGALLITSADILMLNAMRGPTETGYYQLGAQLIGVIAILPNVGVMVIYGIIAKHGVDAAWRQQFSLLLQIVLLLTLTAFALGATATLWLPMIASPEFLPTVGVFQLQLVSLLLMSVGILMGPQWIGRGFFVRASVLTLVVGCANVIANLYLIPRYGMYGAAWATIVCYLSSVLVNLGMMLHCFRTSRRVLGAV